MVILNRIIFTLQIYELNFKSQYFYSKIHLFLSIQEINNHKKNHIYLLD